MSRSPLRIQWLIAIIAWIVLAAKLVAWQITGSVSLFTDALESGVNVLAGAMGLYSVRLAAKPKDLNHPFGHGKVEFLSAFLEGLLIIASAAIIIYQSIDRLLHPRPMTQLDLGIGIAAGTGILNFFVGRLAVRTGKKHRSMVLQSAGQHLLSDALTTLALILGLSLVLISSLDWIDAVVALGFAVYILFSGYKIIRQSLAGIMDEVDEDLLAEVISHIEMHRRTKWIDLHNLRVIQTGKQLHLDAHLTLPWYDQVAQGEHEIHELEDLVKAEFGKKVDMFIHIDACVPSCCPICPLVGCPVRRHPFQERIPWTPANVRINQKHRLPVEADPKVR